MTENERSQNGYLYPQYCDVASDGQFSQILYDGISSNLVVEASMMGLSKEQVDPLRSQGDPIGHTGSYAAVWQYCDVGT